MNYQMASKAERNRTSPQALKTSAQSSTVQSSKDVAFTGLPLFLQPKLAISQPCPACEGAESVTVSRKAQGATGGDAPASVGLVLHSPGQPLDPSTRAFFEPRFGQALGHVRVHTGSEAQQSARDVNAVAYTVGSHVVFGAERYAPSTSDGQWLLAHELTHTIQQSVSSSRGQRLQRQPQEEIEMPGEFAADRRKRTWRRYARLLGQQDAARIRSRGALSADLRDELNAKLRFFEGTAKQLYSQTIRPALIEVTQTEIEMPGDDPGGVPAHEFDKSARTLLQIGRFLRRLRGFPEYIDNNMTEINYFTAELARIHYKDGSTFDLGLVPKWMKPPVVAVDCHTPAEQIRQYEDMAAGQFGFMLESEMATAPRDMSYKDLVRKYVHVVDFYAEPGSGRIIPSHINKLTAPTLCGVLLDSERRYEEQVATAVKIGLGGTLVIGAYAGVGGLPKGPGVAATTLGTRVAARAALSPTARTLAREMDALLARGGSKTITVEGVELAGVEVSQQGSVLAVRRFMSKLPEALRGRGTGLQVTAAFEQAASEVGRLNGVKTVTIDVGLVINAGWRSILESRGYVHILEEGRWVKTIKL